MSGPWADFQPQRPQRPQQPQAPAAPGPWDDFSAPEAAAPPTPPSISSPEPFRARLQEMFEAGTPREEIDRFVADSGYKLHPETQAWMDENYDAWRSDERSWNVPTPEQPQWDVEAPEQQERVDSLPAAWAGVRSGALRGYDDEWAAGWGTAGNMLGTVLGMNESDASMGDIYDQILEKERAYKQRAFETNPVAYGAGFVPGSITGPAFFRKPALTRRGRFAQSVGTGAIEGGLSGSGNAEGGLGDRLTGGATGAGIGGVAAGALHPIIAGGQMVAGRVGERLRPSGDGTGNSLNSGLDVLASRAPQDADAMAARAADMEAAGVPPRLVDVVDESGRGVVRSASNKMTPAREDFAQHADTVYASAQDRVADQARRNISPAPSTAREISERIAQEQKELGPRFDAVRNEPVAITPEITRALNTAEGRSVLRTIGRYMTPDEQTSLNRLIKGLQAAAKQGTAEDQARKLVPGFDRMSPEAQQQVISQLDIKDPMADVNLTVDIADKFSRIIRDRAGENPGMRRVAGDYADTIRGSARQQHPEYDAALNEFEAAAQVGDAAAGTGRFQNTDFMKTVPDQYSRNIGELNTNPARVGDEVLPSQRDVAAVRARDEVVDRATSGSGNQAMSTARQLSQGSAQRQRNRALLGEEGAENLERGMSAEVDRVRNTDFIDPRRGSQTTPMLSDDAATDGMMDFAADSTRGVWGVVHGVARWLRGAGIRGVDAERLVRDAVSEDPARLRTAIKHLQSRGVEVARARSLVRAISATQAGRTAGALSSSEEDRTNRPRSVRAILRNQQGTE